MQKKKKSRRGPTLFSHHCTLINKHSRADYVPGCVEVTGVFIVVADFQIIIF